MKYFVQYNNFNDKFWESSWNFKFVIFDYETRIRTYISPSSKLLRTDTIPTFSNHPKYQTKVVKYDN